MPKNFPRDEGFQLLAVIKGITWALIITIILGVILSILLQFTSLSETHLTSFATFIFFISMLLGATISARYAKCKGLYHGLAVSLAYLILTIAIGLIWIPEVFTWGLILKRTAFTIISGALGGIIGIGLATS